MAKMLNEQELRQRAVKVLAEKLGPVEALTLQLHKNPW